MSTPATESKNMQYVRLGSSGLKISKIILGTMQYGTPTWQDWVLEEEEALQHIKAAYDLGIQTFDTSNVYSNGLSEKILGKAIKQYNLPREEIVVMTKVYFPVSTTDPSSQAYKHPNPTELGFVNQHGLSRKHIFDSIKKSLERLGLEYLDLLQCHRFDYNTPIEETMQALHDVVKAGYVRYIGMSSCWAYQFHAMQNYATTNKLTPFISMQNQYSLIYREEEREMMPTLKLFGVGAIPWSSLARGLLSRPVQGEKTRRGETDQYLNNNYSIEGATGEIISRVEEISKKKGVSMAQVAIAWLLSKDGVSAPIVGTTRLDNLRDIVGAIHVSLTNEEVLYLEDAYVPQAINGHS
ncbi:hypothetical protein JAAARDRAFT_202062 [Jaapia argillacea MUCL 33604]|uniref:NADP-dependent oxidoreductase domain-containing protein n=1 Tax=Jaapia argillacea MUCL 33604 TaxID=933084 RepID=A0A067QML8_9AGAM|nr:hypothetical protein JAAARDRAFT_202062 [Jaapia argillacea MUCL 33604]